MKKEDTLICRSANILIIRKMIRTMKIPMKTFFDEMNVSRTVINEITSGNDAIGSRWTYKDVANKLNVDYKIFSGERLIKIKGESIRYIQDNFEQLVQEGKGSVEAKNALIANKKLYSSEFSLWKAILDEVHGRSQYGDTDIWEEFKSRLLQEVRQQTKNPSFNDPELWKLWFYFNEKYKK